MSHSYLVALIEKQGPVPIQKINPQRGYMYYEEHVEIAKRLQGTGTDLNDFIVNHFNSNLKLNLSVLPGKQQHPQLKWNLILSKGSDLTEMF